MERRRDGVVDRDGARVEAVVVPVPVGIAPLPPMVVDGDADDCATAVRRVVDASSSLSCDGRGRLRRMSPLLPPSPSSPRRNVDPPCTGSGERRIAHADDDAVALVVADRVGGGTVGYSNTGSSKT